MTETKSFAQEVWDTLAGIDISDHTDTIEATEKRGELTYLPWHKAWMLLKREYPASTYKHEADITHPDGSIEVEVEVYIRADTAVEAAVLFTSARLAVMNFFFDAIVNPDARAINDSRQRALVKALAFNGLGLSLWDDGSQIAVGTLDDPVNAKQAKILTELIEKSESDTESFLKWAKAGTIEEIPYERFSSAVKLLEARIRNRSKDK